MSQISPTFSFAPPLAALSKVPQITVIFWIVKLLTTGMGETTSDFLVHQIDPPIAVAIGFSGFVAALVAQFVVTRYSPWIYWLAVVMVSVFGTMAADVLHVGLGIPYAISTAFFAVTLAAIFALWFSIERTLSIHSIRTRRREAFYWATVVTTFALGTASGDLTAVNLGLGYLDFGILFTAVIALPALAYWRFGMPEIPAFWFAYIITRPVGASFADWMGVGYERGGLNWGTGPVSLVMGLTILALVGYLAATHADEKPNSQR
ncbi:MAG: hypothetical protein ABI832_10565 [bacterium]